MESIIPTVMTVDDNKTVREIICASLEERGYDVVVAADGKVALELLQVRRVQLILLDVMMPDLDGLGFLQALRSRDDKTPVVLLTAKTETRVISECLKFGIKSYISKPIIPDQLIREIESLLGPPPEIASMIGVGRGHGWGQILLVDASEKTAFKLRELLPNTVELETALDFQRALNRASACNYGAVLVDNRVKGAELGDALNYLRPLLPHAVFIALFLKKDVDPELVAWELGFDGHMIKPIRQEDMEHLFDAIGYYDYELQNVLSVAGTILYPLPASKYSASLERYFSSLGEQIGDWIEKLGANCAEGLVFDGRNLPESSLSGPLVRMAVQLSLDLGMSIDVVGRDEFKDDLGELLSCDDVRFREI